LRHVNHTAATLAELLEEFVMADLVAEPFPQGDVQVRIPGNSRSGRFHHKMAGSVMRLEQNLQALAQGRIPTTGLCKVSAPFFRGQLRHRFEQRFFGRLGLVHAGESMIFYPIVPGLATKRITKSDPKQSR
jgi:hypothetical protein